MYKHLWAIINDCVVMKQKLQCSLGMYKNIYNAKKRKKSIKVNSCKPNFILSCTD